MQDIIFGKVVVGNYESLLTLLCAFDEMRNGIFFYAAKDVLCQLLDILKNQKSQDLTPEHLLILEATQRIQLHLKRELKLLRNLLERSVYIYNY